MKKRPSEATVVAPLILKKEKSGGKAADGKLGNFYNLPESDAEVES